MAYMIYLQRVSDASVVFTDANGNTLTMSGSDTGGTYYNCTTANVTMRCTPDTDYEFTSWTSTLSGTSYTSTSNPWTIVNYGTDTVTISCTVTYTGVSVWTLDNTIALGTITADNVVWQGFNFSAGHCKCLSFSPAVSGSIHIFSSSTEDPIAYLSSGARFNSTTGEPMNILTSDDDSGTDDNFDMTYNVTGGAWYYLFVRHYYTTGSGIVDIYLTLTQGTKTGWYVFDGNDWVHADPYLYNGSSWVKATPYLYNSGWIAGS